MYNENINDYIYISHSIIDIENSRSMYNDYMQITFLISVMAAVIMYLSIQYTH